MDIEYLSDLIYAMRRYRRTGKPSKILMKAYTESSIIRMSYQDTLYGGMMLESIRVFWNEPTLDQTLRHIVRAVFKHFHLEVKPTTKKRFIKKRKLELHFPNIINEEEEGRSLK